MEVSTAGVTVREALPDTEPDVAVIDAEPAPIPFASPTELMVTKFVALELQTTLSVMSVELPSEKTPLAANVCVWPVAIEAVPGVIVIDCRSAAVTVTVADAVVEPIVAVIVEEPAETPLTRPVEVTVALAVLKEPQTTCLVTSCEVPLL
jgi:hypothetical protein